MNKAKAAWWVGRPNRISLTRLSQDELVLWKWDGVGGVGGGGSGAAGKVVCLPVPMLTERAAVPRPVTAAARLRGLPTAVPTVLQRNQAGHLELKVNTRRTTPMAPLHASDVI